MTPSVPHIVIVGGGITGLACAFRLQFHAQRTRTSVAITVLEASARTGGKVLTETIPSAAGHFIVDAGADIFLANKPAALALCDSVGLADLVETDPTRRKTYLQRHHTLEPAQMYANERLVTPSAGMQALPDAVKTALTEVAIQYETPATGIEATENGYIIQTPKDQMVFADYVIVTLPARQAASLLQNVAPATAEALHTLRYTSTTTISAGFSQTSVSHDLDGYGYLVDNAPLGEITACTWTSSKIPGRAPAGHVLLRGYISKTADVSSHDAERKFLNELHQTLGISVDPLFVRSYLWRDAIPVYGDDPFVYVDAVSDALPQRMYLAGSALYAPGIPDSVRSAYTAADNVWISAQAI